MTPAWRLFPVTAAAVTRLSPTFVRVTFTGDDLDTFADNGFDQRIKIVLPLPTLGFTTFPDGPDWYPAWRALPSSEQNPVRTYTVRAVRPAAREVDIDFALHGEIGPASRWATHVTPGSPAALIGPSALHPGPHGGVEFAPPASGHFLFAGDETAVPAISAILPSVVRATVLLEVPDEADFLPLDAPDGVGVQWYARRSSPPGTCLVPALSSLSSSFSYAWIAGEAGVVRSLRRVLVAPPFSLARDSVTFMGYYRHNHPESL